MPNDSEFQAMADLCIEAGAAVMKSGSDDMRVAMRAVLFILGREIVQRDRTATRAVPWQRQRGGRRG